MGRRGSDYSIAFTFRRKKYMLSPTSAAKPLTFLTQFISVIFSIFAGKYSEF